MEDITKYRDYVKRSAEASVRNAESLQELMRFEAKMKGSLSLENKLLAKAYYADATEIRTEADWRDFGIGVFDKSHPIHQMFCREVGGEEEIQIMYDIDATNALAYDFEQFTDPGFFADRLLLMHPCPIKFFETEKMGGDKVRYSPEDGVIYATNGIRDDTELCQLFLKEYAHFYLHEYDTQLAEREVSNEAIEADESEDYDRKARGLEAHAVMYALCVRHGLETPNMDKVQVSAALTPEDILQILMGIDYAIYRITQLIEDIGNRRERRESCYFREKEHSQSARQ